MKLKLKKPKRDIIDYFENLPTRIFARSDIERILAENIQIWRLSESTTVHSFIKAMLEATQLEAVRFEFPNRTIIRYTWGKVPTYGLVMSLKPDSYLSHYSAVHLHELTDQVPKTIYLNSEQPKKPRGGNELAQDRIDTAFKRPIRVSKNVAPYKDQRICLLNGGYTGQLGVIDMEGPDGVSVRVTNVERTLIDSTVRPAYSGGVFEVLKAYRLAKEKVSVNRLTAMLKRLDYVYPYHQAVGFYLDKSGVYKKSTVDLLRKFDMDYDFYLTYQMKDTSYSKKWRLYYPKGF